MATNPIPNHIIGGDTDTDSSPPHTTVSDVPPPSPSSPRAFASSASAARFGSSSFMSNESGHTTTNTGPVASLPTSVPASSPTTTTALDDDDERHALRNEEALPVIILDAEHSSIQMTDVGITRHRRPRNNDPHEENNAPQDSVSISPHDPAMTIPEEASETVPASSRSIIPTTTNNDSTSSALPSPPPSPRSHRRPSEPSASCSSPSRSSASSELPRTQWPWTPPTTPPHLSFTIFLDAEQQPQPAIDDLQILAPPQLLNMEGSNSSPFREAVEEGRADDSTPSSSRSSSGAGAREHGSLLGANNVPDHLLAVSHPDPAWGFPRAAAANSFGACVCSFPLLGITSFFRCFFRSFTFCCWNSAFVSCFLLTRPILEYWPEGSLYVFLPHTLARSTLATLG
ncbi:hypothetical protein DL93DRAFT_422816 [Clavulina sp. PMI_390]|nr:hypothetical protein DL93DRAFT_422816 [Clavulina sp. PMI_390]